MTKTMLTILVAAPMTLAANIATAQQPVRAVQAFEAAARVSPDDGGAVIELANAYRSAGRVADADVAYRRALVLDNVMLETRSGDAIWSHEVARRLLSKQVLLSAK